MTSAPEVDPGRGGCWKGAVCPLIAEGHLDPVQRNRQLDFGEERTLPPGTCPGRAAMRSYLHDTDRIAML